jgi:hypothetical protein
MHDSASAHFLLAVWEFMNNLFLEQWMGRDGQQHGLLVPLISVAYIFISGDT